MRNRNGASPGLSPTEVVWGWGYWAFQLFLLPSILSAVNGILTKPFSGAEINFLFFLINFLAVILIFHVFLGRSFRQVTAHPAYFCQAVILGLVAYFACAFLVEKCVRLLDPGFHNYNDASIAALGSGNYFLTALGTVVFVPAAEECFYRGLFFRHISGKSLWAAYLLSVLVFAVVHIIGFIGVYSPLGILLSFLQYLPAGLCLAWSYAKSGTIFAPILIHTIINAYGIFRMR